MVAPVKVPVNSMTLWAALEVEDLSTASILGEVLRTVYCKTPVVYASTILRLLLVLYVLCT